MRKGGGQLRLHLIPWFLILTSIPAVLPAVPVQADQTASNTTTVAANIAESIAVTQWPESLLNLAGEVVPGQSVVSGPLVIQVKSNATWGLKISSDLPDGRMKEFDSSTAAYVSNGLVLSTPLQWSTDVAGPWQDLSSTEASVVAGQPPTGDSGTSVTIYVRLQAGYDDLPLSTGHEYRILLRYTAGVNY